MRYKVLLSLQPVAKDDLLRSLVIIRKRSSKFGVEVLEHRLTGFGRLLDNGTNPSAGWFYSMSFNVPDRKTLRAFKQVLLSEDLVLTSCVFPYN